MLNSTLASSEASLALTSKRSPLTNLRFPVAVMIYKSPLTLLMTRSVLFSPTESDTATLLDSCELSLLDSLLISLFAAVLVSWSKNAELSVITDKILEFSHPFTIFNTSPFERVITMSLPSTEIDIASKI